GAPARAPPAALRRSGHRRRQGGCAAPGRQLEGAHRAAPCPIRQRSRSAAQRAPRAWREKLWRAAPGRNVSRVEQFGVTLTEWRPKTASATRTWTANTKNQQEE